MGNYNGLSVKQNLLNSLKNNMLIIVYDLETTGLSEENHHIIQLYAMKCFTTDDGLQAVDAKNWYINPQYSLPELIVKRTGITDEFLADKPLESEVIEEIISYFEFTAVCGHNNTGFDDLFMAKMYKRYGYAFSPVDSIDNYQIAKNILSPKEIPDYKLPTVAGYYGFDEMITQFHNAQGDSMAVLLCINKFTEICKAYLKEKHNLIQCHIKSIVYWESKKTWKQKRIYVNTVQASFWFDVIHRSWNIATQEDQLSRYDIEDLKHRVYVLTGSKGEDDFAKFRSHIVLE